jgi:hypothetical protein
MQVLSKLHQARLKIIQLHDLSSHHLPVFDKLRMPGHLSLLSLDHLRQPDEDLVLELAEIL